MGSLTSIVLNLLSLSVSIFLVAQLMPGVKVRSFGAGVKVAVVYSIIDLLLYKLLAFFAAPFILLTFGLFVLVINGFLLWLTNALMDDFEIDGCSTAVLASLLISVCNVVLHWIF